MSPRTPASSAGAVTSTCRPVLEVLGDPAHPARTGRHVLVTAPAEDAGVRGLTTDRVRVERAARLGYAAMRVALDAVT